MCNSFISSLSLLPPIPSLERQVAPGRLHPPSRTVQGLNSLLAVWPEPSNFPSLSLKARGTGMDCCSLPSGPLPLQLDPQQRWACLAWDGHACLPWASERWHDRAAGGGWGWGLPQTSGLSIGSTPSTGSASPGEKQEVAQGLHRQLLLEPAWTLPTC